MSFMRKLLGLGIYKISRPSVENFHPPSTNGGNPPPGTGGTGRNGAPPGVVVPVVTIGVAVVNCVGSGGDW